MLLLAGCTSKDSDEPAPGDTPNATVGAISGATVTPAINPIKDAVVTLEPGGQSDETGIFGTFRFEALPPGTYRLAAAAPGFLPAEETVVVRAGETTSIRIPMQYDVPPEPRIETLTFSGYFSANFGAADDASQPAKDLAGIGNCTCVYQIEAPRYLAGVTVEAVWDDSVDAADGATFRWNATFDDGAWAGGSGTSPMHGVVDDSDLNLTGVREILLEILPDETRPVYEQRFDVYVTLWEVEGPDPEWSALD